MQDYGSFDLVIVGAGFAAAFFLRNALRAPGLTRILVLERGKRHSHAWQLDHGRHNDLAEPRPHRDASMAGKWWTCTIGFGGGSNCWWTNAMRIHPADFELQSRYGVGVDWPLNYDALEPYYSAAEEECWSRARPRQR